MKESIPILCYRSISPVCGIPPAEFRSHLEWLAAAGWKSVPLSQVVRYVKGGAALPEKSYALTFDNVYLDHWVHTVPLLREFGVCAAFACATAYLHDGPCRPDSTSPGVDLRSLPMSREAWANALEKNDPRGFMNRIELRILVEEGGHELVGGTHTRQACFRSAKPMGRGGEGGQAESGQMHGIYVESQEGLPMYPTGSAYAYDGFWPGGDLFDHRLVRRETAERIEFCLNEFVLCRERLEEITGKASQVLAWPWGEYDGVAVETAALAGYEAALSLEQGPNRPGTSPFALCRIRMQGGDGVKELARRMKRGRSPVLSMLFRRHTGRIKH